MELRYEQKCLKETTMCGELYVCKNGDFLYSCALCYQTYANSQLFEDHIFTTHTYLNILSERNDLSDDLDHEIENAFNLSIGVADVMMTNKYENTNQNLNSEQANSDEIIENTQSDFNEVTKIGGLEDSQPQKIKIRQINPFKKLGRPKKHETNIIIPKFEFENTKNCIHETSTPINDKTPTGYWKCIICSLVCKNDHERQEHEKLHQKANSIGVICETCGKGFKNRRILSVHIRVHTGERPYKCQFCPMAFGQSGALHNHERQHTGEKPFQCKYCEKRFFQSGLCKTHELTHTLSEKPYGCHICEKRFLRPHNLTDHIKTHNYKPNKPYACSSCSKFFKSITSLKVHEIFHREEAYQFQCNYCDKKFVNLGSKHKHELIHTQAGQLPYECIDCDKKYAHETSLSKHRKRHHNNTAGAGGNTVRPRFKCSYCDRIFLKLKSKDKHQLSHSLGGPTSYKCNLCSRKYAFKHGLKKHQKRKHNMQ